MLQGTGRLKGPHEVVVETADGLSRARRRRRAAEHRQPAPHPRLGAGRRRPRAHHPRRLPAARAARAPVVVGSGVTGVEFVHMFSSFGCQVTLIVSRQQVLPQKDPEVAAALEDDFLRRGVRLLQGRPGHRHRRRRRRRRRSRCDDGRSAAGTHALLAIGSIPNSEGLGLDERRRRVDDGGYVVVNHNCQSSACRTSTPRATCRASCRCRRWPRCRAARSPSTRWACTPGRTATSTTRRRRRPSSPSPRSPTSGLAEADAFAVGPQDPGDQGAVLGQRQGAHRRTTRAGS